jgi:hypothetical protein
LVGISLVISMLITGAGGQASAVSTPVSSVTWEQWLHIPGILDLGGPRRDGRVVAAALGQLVLVSPSGMVTDFAPGYSVPEGPESYVAVSPGLAVKDAGCRFGRDVVLALDLRASPPGPPGITRISASGIVTHLATVNGASGLGGIALDTVGDFGHRLLVTGPSSGGHTQVWAIDCRGMVTPIGTVPTALEGGIAVAPRGFGKYGGQLVGPNEGDGSIYAVSKTGQLSKVAESGVPAGGDIGVESVGFVPAARVTAYLADRGTPVSGQPHPGTDSLLRLNAKALRSIGVRRGDLLVATEGAATVVRIRCAPRCVVDTIATGPLAAHGEGHLLLVPRR